MATSVYTCGPAALATILKSMGIYTTEAEIAKLAGTDETGTSLYGLKTAAQAKGATAIGARLTTDQLKTNYMVVLSINGVNHFEVVLNITDTTVYLFDPNLGNIEMTLDNFNELYTGVALLINDQAPANATILTDEEMQNIKALAYKVKKTVTKVWVPGYYYKAGVKWVDTSYYVPRLSLVWVNGYWAHWGPFSWYVFPHPELRLTFKKINRGYWQTIWKYKPGYWTKRTTFEVVHTINPKKVESAFYGATGIVLGGVGVIYGALSSPFDDGKAGLAIGMGLYGIWSGGRELIYNKDPLWTPVGE